jgi:hypothetical protein
MGCVAIAQGLVARIVEPRFRDAVLTRLDRIIGINIRERAMTRSSKVKTWL